MIRLASTVLIIAGAMLTLAHARYTFVQAEAYALLVEAATPTPAAGDGQMPVAEPEGECILDSDATLSEMVEAITAMDEAEAMWVIETALDHLGKRKGA